MMTPARDNARAILRALWAIIDRVNAETVDAWIALPVTMPQLRTLMLLRERGAMRVSALAGAMRITSSTVTGIIDRLVRQGLVHRVSDPGDRRVVLNALTADGEQLMQRLQERGDAALHRLVRTLSPEEQSDLAQSLTRLDAVLGAVPSLRGSTSNEGR